MPLYEYKCLNGHKFSRVLPLKDYKEVQYCECGIVAEKVLSLPQVFVRAEVHYRCPITDIPITSAKAHEENLKKHGCRVYESGETEAFKRRRQKEDEALEERISETAVQIVEQLPSETREQLGRELESGLTPTTMRQSA